MKVCARRATNSTFVHLPPAKILSWIAIAASSQARTPMKAVRFGASLAASNDRVPPSRRTLNRVSIGRCRKRFQDCGPAA